MEIVWLPIEAVSRYENNPRNNAHAVEKVAASIHEYGWQQPIVVNDGFVPVVYIDADPMHRMMSTIRHNRARGTHAVLKMASIVRQMAQAGLPPAEICNRLGMEDEELERLLDRAGMTVRGTRGATAFGKAWVPSRNP